MLASFNSSSGVCGEGRVAPLSGSDIGLSLSAASGFQEVINIWTNKETKNLPDDERRKTFYDKLGLTPSDDSDKPLSNTNTAQGNLFGETPTPLINPIKNPKPPRKPKPRPPVNLSRDREIFIDWNACETVVPESRSKEFHIFVEMCRLSSKDIPIACVVMLRVFLETTVKQANVSMKLRWQNLSKSSLRASEILHKEGYINDPVKELVKQYANTDGGLFSINNIQSHIHSTKFDPTQPKANNYWDELDPFLAGCWRFIQDTDNALGVTAT